jgi:uroporphyrin-III C-methyltransferase
VIYMGVARCSEIQQSLLAGGKSALTPVAVIQSATSAKQAQLITTLGELPAALALSTLASPSIIVIGDVVRCARPEFLNEAMHRRYFSTHGA